MLSDIFGHLYYSIFLDELSKEPSGAVLDLLINMWEVYSVARPSLSKEERQKCLLLMEKARDQLCLRMSKT